MDIEGRCMRCKDKKVMKDVNVVKTARGGFMAKGKCTQCDCGMCKIMSKDQAQQVSAELNIPLPE